MAGAPRPEGAGADPDGPPGGVGGEGDEGSDEGSEVHDGRPTLLVVVNKIDTVGPDGILGHLAAVAAVIEESDRQAGVAVPVEYFPVSATTGEGVDALIAAVIERLPEGPRYYPEGMVTDVAEAFWVADLVREELLHRVEDELPHSIACRVTEWEWPRVRCEILVERDSQKGIVIGKGGEILKEVGTAVRHQMPPGAYLELFVRVEKRWQRREDALDRLGL
jgi:GTP-binding protein Era